ncbi:MAG: bifunctional adenosylcobinamide kinase/adenosylcobinamide-phosphate guanylyltransferase [Lachnospiraceae bacterium]|nr:bifunctional adenosylcobinamide kinase/adenosylcobinamide-phosphate guanylyltransferase [Lachnospiraceae bacterium]
MLALIIGGSGSGKSQYAEDYICSLSENKEKYYIATMKIYDDEMEKKVERHRNMRKNKGFITIEQPQNIGDAILKMKSDNNNALLECMSNLVANEMFCDNEFKDDSIADIIVNDIIKLYSKMDNLVIVTNNIHEDGMEYDIETKNYMRTLGIINNKLASYADTVIEVVVGIPVVYKGAAS